MVDGKNKKWKKLLEYESIKTYLNGSIGSKSKAIGESLTLEEKVKNVRLSQYLLGVDNFIKGYSTYMFENEQFPRNFNECYEFLDYIEEVRGSDDRSLWNKLLRYLDDYTVWLKEVRGLSGKTAINYQAQLRGYLNWNGAGIKLQTKEELSEVSKEQGNYSFDNLEKLLEFGKKVIEYAPDFELKTLLNWMLRSGLGKAEIMYLKMKDLRNKDLDQEFVEISKTRKKTGVTFITFIYGDLKRDIQKLMEYQHKDKKGNNTLNNKDKGDKDYLFGENPDRLQNDNNFDRRFSRAYKKCVQQEFPQYLKAKRKLFTMHKYRHVFETICDELRVPKSVENFFVGHKQFGTDKSYKKKNKRMQKDFKKIQEFIFGIKESSTREEIKAEIIKDFTEALLNKGKRVNEFKRYENATTQEEKEAFSNQVKMNFFLEKIINIAKSDAKKELLQDEGFLKAIAEKMTNSNKI